MQIPAEWVAPILSIFGMIGSLIIFILLRYTAKRERENIAEQVRLYRKAKAQERLIDSLAECHKLLIEGLRVCALVTRPLPPKLLAEVMRDADRIANSVSRHSWLCNDLADEIQETGILVRKIFSTEKYSEFVPSIGAKIAQTMNKIEGKIRDVLGGESA
ncbi:MAG: hypothetical protein ACXAEN_19235 [Candidatus Thorarchaeota archaeon]|jgi:hypothetical protein